MVFIGCQAVDERTAAAVDPINQPFVDQQIQNSIDGYAVDVGGTLEGLKYLLGAQRTAVVADHFQHALAVGGMPQTGCF